MFFINIFKKTIPWIVAAAIFAYLFHKYPISQVYKAVAYVRLWPFIISVVAYFVFLFMIDTWITAKVLTRFSHPVKMKDTIVGRGLTYLIMVINYPASQAAFAYYLKKTRKIPITEAISVFFFIALVDLYWIISVAFAGSFFQEFNIVGINLGRFVQVVALLAYVALALKLIFWKHGVAKFFGLKKEFRAVVWIKNKSIFHTFNKAKLKDYLRLFIWRAPIHITIIIFFYFVIRTFDCTVPLAKVVCNLPIVFLIGVLPITPGGLGTTNAAMVALISPYVHGAIIDNGVVTAEEFVFTSTLLWVFANYSLKAITGLIFLKLSSTKLFKLAATAKTSTDIQTLTPPSQM